jgi:heavy metal translocating P-type ATPase
MTDSTPPQSGLVRVLSSRQGKIAVGTLVGLLLWLLLRLIGSPGANYPLYAVLVLGGSPLIFDLLKKMVRGQFGSDLLAGVSIVTAVCLEEWIAAVLVVLMLSGGEALEELAIGRAGSVLQALARRIPRKAHRRQEGQLTEIPVEEIKPGDEIVILPHEIAPVDGEVLVGHGSMDEAYLTGEPFRIEKAPGSAILSGAVNGESALTVRATKLAIDSRYAKITEVMRETAHRRVPLRRLGDILGAWYTPLALLVAGGAWIVSGDPIRFLAVTVIATPCPLLIAIPVAIIGSVSLAAKRGIVIRDPAVLEQVVRCRTMILDKTGTLTYGEPVVQEVVVHQTEATQVMAVAAALEAYSRHPLARAVRQWASSRGVSLPEVSAVREVPGSGLTGTVGGQTVAVTSRKKFAATGGELPPSFAGALDGLESLVLVNGNPAALIRYTDRPREESHQFISHLGPGHQFERIMIVSGDRESSVKVLADQVGITTIFAGQSPEQKVAIVKAETERAPTMYLGDGINDAPALLAATVGVAFGAGSDVTSEAAGAVILDASLIKVDEFMHIGARMRRIALQSAVGGMALSFVGMIIAAAGYLPPVGGALAQEAIDLLAVLNALRVAYPPPHFSDMGG